MNDNDVNLVDNHDFLNYASVTPNPVTFEGAPPLPTPINLTDDVKMAFLTEYGASPFETVEDLKAALATLFRFRSINNLEQEVAAGISIPNPDLSICSIET